MVDFMEEKLQSVRSISTTLSVITSKTTNAINVNNMTNYAFQIGDFLQIDDEIMRISRTVSRTSGDAELRIFRGVFGSIADTHVVERCQQGKILSMNSEEILLFVLWSHV